MEATKEHNHKWKECSGCGEQEGQCIICDGGLSICVACGGAEGSLPTHCPGERMTEKEESDVYAWKIDFIEGEWVNMKEKYDGLHKIINTLRDQNDLWSARNAICDILSFVANKDNMVRGMKYQKIIEFSESILSNIFHGLNISEDKEDYGTSVAS